MKKKKYLPLYYEWMEDGKLPLCGLCCSIGDFMLDPDGVFCEVIFTNEYLNLFEPVDYFQHPYYWGFDYGTDNGDVLYDFTTLRQTILLFLAAMNNEL